MNDTDANIGNSSRRAVIFIAWGQQYVDEVYRCIDRSPILHQYDLVLITDLDCAANTDRVRVERVSFRLRGLLRKAELLDLLPPHYDSILLLDSDTRIIGDINLGFDKAELHGIALAPAPHYSLDHFWGFEKIMAAENIECRGQLQYNTGVIFLHLTEPVRTVLRRWMAVCVKHQDAYDNDQPFFTLAMEQLGFNPYTLSISYNYRGFEDNISGIVRVWHSHGEMPEDINEFDRPWPPRRARPGRVIRPPDPA